MYSVKGGLLCILRHEPKSASLRIFPPLSIRIFSGYNTISEKTKRYRDDFRKKSKIEAIPTDPIEFFQMVLENAPLYLDGIWISHACNLAQRTFDTLCFELFLDPSVLDALHTVKF